MAIEQRNVSTLAGLIVEIRKLNTAQGWRDHMPVDKPGFMAGPWFAAYCALATSEVSEALDAYRVKQWSATCKMTGPVPQDHVHGCSGRPHDYPKPVGVGPELADALIRLLDMIDIWNVDIEYELARVLEYGWTRPYQHGGKVL